MNMHFITAGKRLRFWRKKNGISQSELAEKAQVGRTFVVRLESDEYSGTEKPESLASLARALNLDADGFVLMNTDRTVYDHSSPYNEQEENKRPTLSAIDSMAEKIAAMVATDDPEKRDELRERIALDSFNLMLISVDQVRNCNDKISEFLAMIRDEPEVESREMLGDLVLKMAEIMSDASEETTIMNAYARSYAS